MFSEEKAKNVYRKGSFFSLVFLLVVTTGYYIFRTVVGTSGFGRAIGIAMCFWPGTMFIAFLFFNFTPRAPFFEENCDPPPSLRFRENCWSGLTGFCGLLKEHARFILYWFAILIYFCEAMFVWVDVALDVAHEVAPLIEKEFQGESWRFKGVVVFLVTFSFAFHSRMLSLYWSKYFMVTKTCYLSHAQN